MLLIIGMDIKNENHAYSYIMTHYARIILPERAFLFLLSA